MATSSAVVANFRVPPEATLHHLIRQLPIPLALFETGADAGMANDRFAEVFLAGQLDDVELKRLAHRPGRGWQAVDLRRRDGAVRAARALAIGVQSGVLLVVEDSVRPQSADEYARLQQRIAELEDLSATDRLTGAWNRVQLERMVDVEMQRAERLNQSVTLLMLDIDHFKRVNDVHGHLVGDAVLKEFVERIRGRMRGTDSLFRWGGEEFVVLAVGIGYRGGAALAECLREAIAAEPFATAGPVTASLGVAEYIGTESADDWLHRVDRMLYAAKAGGRNRICVDRRGNSDLAADRSDVGLLRLTWLESYECGEPTIDAEHRELFDLGNALMAAAIKRDPAAAAVPAALNALLQHVARHFRDEEAVLALHGYRQLAAHKRAHASLLRRAGELKAAVDGNRIALGTLVNFIVRDVIAGHLFKADRQFFPLFQRADVGAIGTLTR